MEILFNTIAFALLLGLIAVPIILFIALKKWYRLKFGFMVYLVSGLVFTAGGMWAYAWWADYSDQLLMGYYGYDFEAMNDTGRYANVKSENLEKLKRLEIGYFGVGWPLKAGMLFVFYSPYLLLVYLIGQGIASLKRKKK